MQLPLSALLALLFLAPSHLVAAADKPLKPCTAISPTTQRFFDLNPMHRARPDDTDGKSKKKAKEAEEGSWHARGYDYGANFTLNFCGPVVEELGNVEDLGRDEKANVSAFYETNGKTWSIGSASFDPVFRGRKLVLNYTEGSLCPSATSRMLLHSPRDIGAREIVDGDDDDKQSNSAKRRKSSIISLLCESDPLAKTSISFVAAVDDCVYFFEGRSPHACGGVHIEKQALGPGGVFGVICLIAILVYVAGGCVYQRTVMHQRGWRQLPNYQMWAGIAQFVADMFIIATSSCARFLPSRRGYSRVSLGADSRGRARRSDDEDRLIDNLDEEWDD
ncbi:mannose 6-phosphate receptor domain-containing protein [Massarina eburnea CBS 473.64]|uniref:Mannose 6-phosphate receptor domain-containing protein n=1 Tax=Massarina eburnea CBS 473.64 TaxID=1395130 RepID=A0A6A6S1B0_9PLEO|nr:mannose 6-phosphate receptor domain-containing protein [Massarina eburnea CBS 473.64]